MLLSIPRLSVQIFFPQTLYSCWLHTLALQIQSYGWCSQINGVPTLRLWWTYWRLLEQRGCQNSIEYSKWCLGLVILWRWQNLLHWRYYRFTVGIRVIQWGLLHALLLRRCWWLSTYTWNSELDEGTGIRLGSTDSHRVVPMVNRGWLSCWLLHCLRRYNFRHSPRGRSYGTTVQESLELLPTLEVVCRGTTYGILICLLTLLYHQSDFYLKSLFYENSVK